MESTKSPSDTLWTVEFTFHNADNVPVADVPGFSSDPFLACYLSVPFHPQHGDDDPLEFRTHTMRHTLNPTWNAKWRVAGIPSTGFKLTIRLRDEDPGDHDDRLGTVIVRERTVNSTLQKDRQEYNVMKRRGSIRAYFLTYLASAVSKNISIHARLTVSIKVIGESPNQKDRRVYTVGPHWWSIHYSPLIGKITGTRGPSRLKPKSPSSKSQPPKTVSTFQANKLQLGGPVPIELKHHFVGYRPFIEWLFTRKGLRGRVLHFGLKRQYSLVYYYSKSTEYGVIDEEGDRNLVENDEKNASSSAPAPNHSKDPNARPPAFDNNPSQTNGKLQPYASASSASPQKPQIPSPEDPYPLATQFLKMTHYGTSFRLYTYVITLDGEWRFTETGPEFAIDMLSKHSMHANLAEEVAYSGEFFVRLIGEGDGQGEGESVGDEKESNGETNEESDGRNKKHEPEGRTSGAKENIRPREHQQQARSRDPKHYELVIDNDSGTYRPKKEFLPIFQAYLASPSCLSGLGNIRAMDGFDDELKGMKEVRAKLKAELKKKRKSGGSDEVDDESQSGGGPMHRLIQATSSLSLNSEEARNLGLSSSGSVSSSDIEDLVVHARKKEVEEEAKEEQQIKANGHANGDIKEDRGDGYDSGKDKGEDGKKKEMKEVEGKLEALEDAAN